jgi:hypothetical protein
MNTNRSVGIVRSRTQTMEFSFSFSMNTNVQLSAMSNVILFDNYVFHIIDLSVLFWK